MNNYISYGFLYCFITISLHGMNQEPSFKRSDPIPIPYPRVSEEEREACILKYYDLHEKNLSPLTEEEQLDIFHQKHHCAQRIAQYYKKMAAFDITHDTSFQDWHKREQLCNTEYITFKNRIKKQSLPTIVITPTTYSLNATVPISLLKDITEKESLNIQTKLPKQNTSCLLQ